MAIDRAEWMAILARIPHDTLRDAFASWSAQYPCKDLVGPDVGTIQLKTTSPLDRTPFYAGDATVTKSVVVVSGLKGYALVLGSDRTRARMAAFFDALMQMPQLRDRLEIELLRPAAGVFEAGRQRRRADAQETSVRFFTAAGA